MHEVNVFWELLASCKAAGRIDLFDESAFEQTLQRAVRALIGTDPQGMGNRLRLHAFPVYPLSEKPVLSREREPAGAGMRSDDTGPQRGWRVGDYLELGRV